MDHLRKAEPCGCCDGDHCGAGHGDACVRFRRPVGGVIWRGGSIVCYSAVHLVKRGLKTDDALDVLGVHGVGGTLGTLLVPFLVSLGAGGVPFCRVPCGTNSSCSSNLLAPSALVRSRPRLSLCLSRRG